MSQGRSPATGDEENRFGIAIGLLLKAANHLEEIGGSDTVLRPIDAFLKTVHPLECGPMARTCIPSAARCSVCGAGEGEPCRGNCERKPVLFDSQPYAKGDGKSRVSHTPVSSIEGINEYDAFAKWLRQHFRGCRDSYFFQDILAAFEAGTRYKPQSAIARGNTPRYEDVIDPDGPYAKEARGEK